MKIIVDTAEPKKIINYFKKMEVDIEQKHLPIGDIYYKEKDIIIERKEIGDFINSMRSGHLQKQLLQMQQFSYKYLIISGSLKNYTMARMKTRHYMFPWTVEHHTGALASCAVRYGVTILNVDNDSQLCKLAYKIFEKTDDGKKITLKDTELLKNTITTEDMILKIMVCFNGFGIKKSEKFLKENPLIKTKIQELINLINKK